MFTRSASRALRVSIYNDLLPEEVLLEIFEAYRQIFELQSGYEIKWNSRDGWFKLAHVCLRWRRVVFLSSSRLHVYLRFTPHRHMSSSEFMLTILRRLPRFPIIVDHRTWNRNLKATKEYLVVAALGQHNRVRRIVLEKPRFGSKLLEALNHPFPELESLYIGLRHGPELVLPPTFLSGSTPCLRQLTLQGVAPEGLSPLLSSMTSLVELTLRLRVVPSAPPETSLLTSLKRMPYLRRLELEFGLRDFCINTTPNSSSHPASAGNVVLLSKLTHFIFRGYDLYLQMLMDGLATPSLQHLDVQHFGSLPFSSISRLCKFICDIERRFITVRLDLLHGKLDFSEEPLSKFTESQAFLIPLWGSISLGRMGNMHAVLLSAVEELDVEWDVQAIRQRHNIQLRGFFKHTREVKTIQVTSELVVNVARSFEQDESHLDLDLLPALEQIKVRNKAPNEPRKKDPYASIRRAFGPLIAARKRVGRPIVLSWTY